MNDSLNGGLRPRPMGAAKLPVKAGPPVTVTVNGKAQACQPDERLIELLNRLKLELPQMCYHSSLGVLATCDSCIVKVDGKLVRACEQQVRADMQIDVDDEGALAARQEAMNRTLRNHELYCTICDFNNGTCEVHNATQLVQLRHQKYPFKPKPYPVDDSNPFYRYDPHQCIQCGRCIEACQNVQVTETLDIDVAGGQKLPGFSSQIGDIGRDEQPRAAVGDLVPQYDRAIEGRKMHDDQPGLDGVGHDHDRAPLVEEFFGDGRFRDCLDVGEHAHGIGGARVLRGAGEGGRGGKREAERGGQGGQAGRVALGGHRELRTDDAWEDARRAAGCRPRRGRSRLGAAQ